MYTFTKEERLCGEKLISKLFTNGSSFLVYPFRLTWLTDHQLTVPAKVLISVPKRNFSRAVDRNILKRRIREAYRLNKNEFFYLFLRENNVQIFLAIAYIGKEITDYSFLEKKLKLAFEKFKGVYHEAAVGRN